MPDPTGTGGTIYKVARAGEPIEDLQIEAGLLNAENVVHEAQVLRAILTDAPTAGSPEGWFRTGSYVILRYHVDDLASVLSYPLGWKPRSVAELRDWQDQLVKTLGRLARWGWGYTGLIEFFHDVATARRYSLGSSPPGCIDNLWAALRYANVRALGLLFDFSPQHMTSFAPEGPTRGQLAEVIRDQAFQVGLIFATVLRTNGWASGQAPEAFGDLLKRLGDTLGNAYGATGLTWENLLPISLDGVAREVMAGMDHGQGALRKDLGFDNSPLSIPALAAFSETLGRAIAQRANLGGSLPNRSQYDPHNLRISA